MITKEEIDQANLEELFEMSFAAMDDLRCGITTPQQSETISRRIRKRLKTINAEMKKLGATDDEEDDRCLH